MKLAPPHGTLQPLPPDVRAAVSQSVQRTASAADIQTIQNVQIAQQTSASAQQNSALPVTSFAPTSASDSLALWTGLIIAAVIAGGMAWLWKKLGE